MRPRGRSRGRRTSVAGRSRCQCPAAYGRRRVTRGSGVGRPCCPPPPAPPSRTEPWTSRLSRHNVSVKSSRLGTVATYTYLVPKLWTETIEAHRREVRDAILDTSAALVAEHGLLAVTMSQIAEETGIGRATLYKYFPDVEAILPAWHDRQLTAHLAYLSEVRDQGTGAWERLEAVLEAYALLSRHARGHQDPGFAELLHRDDRIGEAQ